MDIGGEEGEGIELTMTQLFQERCLDKSASVQLSVPEQQERFEFVIWWW